MIRNYWPKRCCPYAVPMLGCSTTRFGDCKAKRQKVSSFPKPSTSCSVRLCRCSPTTIGKTISCCDPMTPAITWALTLTGTNMCSGSRQPRPNTIRIMFSRIHWVSRKHKTVFVASLCFDVGSGHICTYCFLYRENLQKQKQKPKMSTNQGLHLSVPFVCGRVSRGRPFERHNNKLCRLPQKVFERIEEPV